MRPRADSPTSHDARFRSSSWMVFVDGGRSRCSRAAGGSACAGARVVAGPVEVGPRADVIAPSPPPYVLDMIGDIGERGPGGRIVAVPLRECPRHAGGIARHAPLERLELRATARGVV